MRFLHVNHRYYPYVGGSERYMQEVSEMFAVAGHDVTVVTSDAYDLEYFWDRSRKRVDDPSREVVNGVDVRRVPVRHFPASPFIFQASRRGLGELSRIPMPRSVFEFVSCRLPWLPSLPDELSAPGGYDLVHAANIGIEGLALHAMREARRWDVPFVMTPFVHLGRENDRVARRYVSMPHQTHLLRNAQCVIVMTQMEASFVSSLGIAAKRIHITGVGIDANDVTGGDSERFRSRHNLSGTVVGAAGAVAFEKGARETVLAIGELRRRGHDVSLVLAGPRLGPFDDWFRSLPEANREGIILPGFISAEEKRDMLAALDVLAMPSRTESFGIAYLEGWANRKPVLAARAGAVTEIVRHGVNGLVVDYGDVNAVRDGILDLLSDQDKAQSLGDAGYAMTMERFTWSKVLKRVGRAYAQTLGHPTLPGGSIE
jgi:glycogen synthase